MEHLREQIFDAIRQHSKQMDSLASQLKANSNAMAETLTSIQEQLPKAKYEQLQDAKATYTEIIRQADTLTPSLQKGQLLVLLHMLEPIVHGSFEIVTHCRELYANLRSYQDATDALIKSIVNIVQEDNSSHPAGSKHQTPDHSDTALNNAADDSQTPRYLTNGCNDDIDNTANDNQMEGSQDPASPTKEMIEETVCEILGMVPPAIDQKKIHSTVQEWKAFTDVTPVAIALALSVGSWLMQEDEAEKLAEETFEEGIKEANARCLDWEGVRLLIIDRLRLEIERQKKMRKDDEYSEN
jgi:hypothetical protein